MGSSQIKGILMFCICLICIIVLFCVLYSRMKYNTPKNEAPIVKNPSAPNEQKSCPGIETLLDCKCTRFDAGSSEIEILGAYKEAFERGKQEGFVPIIIVTDDDSLLVESILYNSGCDDGVDIEKISDYRKDLLSSPVGDGQSVLAERKTAFEMEDEWEVWLEEIAGAMEGGYANNEFVSIRDFQTKKTLPAVLAEIPVENPWEVFAYLPFGGWNACPEASEIMAVAKYWYEKYGAVPVVITSDVLEFSVSEPVSESDAMALAEEQFYFCNDIVDQGVGTIGALADTLRQSKVWYFWWD